MKKTLYKARKPMDIAAGEEEDNVRGLKLAHAYVLWQHYDKAFSPPEALMKGTLFPELYGVYMIP